jgi:hypothetical protein
MKNDLTKCYRCLNDEWYAPFATFIENIEGVPHLVGAVAKGLACPESYSPF